MAVSRSGWASSMNPQPTSRCGAHDRSTSAKVQYSATPAAERLPWPTSSSEEWSAIAIGHRQSHESVERRRGHRAAALLADVADRRQTAVAQRLLRLGGADETDGQADHERR